MLNCSPEEIERLRREIGKKQSSQTQKDAGTKVTEQTSKDTDSGNESNDSLGSPEKENVPELGKPLINGTAHADEIVVSN